MDEKEFRSKEEALKVILPKRYEEHLKQKQDEKSTGVKELLKKVEKKMKNTV